MIKGKKEKFFLKFTILKPNVILPPNHLTILQPKAIKNDKFDYFFKFFFDFG